MACAKGFPAWGRYRTTAASAETRCAAAAAASPATTTTAMAGSTGRAEAPVRQKRGVSPPSCAAPRFDGSRAAATFARQHARMQKQQQFGRRTASGMGREQPVELGGLKAHLLTVKRH